MSFITKIFGGGAEKVIGAVGGVLDNLITSKEEKAQIQLEITKEINRAFEAIQADATKQFELEVKDRESARTREADFVKATGHIDWMQMAVGILVMGSFMTTVWFVATQPLPEGSEHLLINAMGILEGMVLAVVGYYYGSSAGSRIKDQMRK